MTDTTMSKIIFYFIIFLFPLVSFAQLPDFSQKDSIRKSVPKKPFIIQTNDGEEYIGVIEDISDYDVTIITTKFGKVIIQKYTIKKMEPVTEENFKSGKYIKENKFPNRYILGNNALPMEKQKIDIYAFDYLCWSANYAFNETFSSGISFEFLYVFMVNSKASFKIGNETYLGPELHLGGLWLLPGVYF